MFAAKTHDEMKALQLCQSKVKAKKLPMEVIDAEYQWYVFIFQFCDNLRNSSYAQGSS